MRKIQAFSSQITLRTEIMRLFLRFCVRIMDRLPGERMPMRQFTMLLCCKRLPRWHPVVN